MIDVETQTRILLLAGRSVFQKGKQLDELINKIQSNVEALTEVKDKMYSGIDDSLRSAIFLLNGIQLDTQSGVRVTDPVEDTISHYFFSEKVNDEEFFKKFQTELKAIKENMI